MRERGRKTASGRMCAILMRTMAAERERERERERGSACERVSVCVCMCVRERAEDCLRADVHHSDADNGWRQREGEGEGEGECVYESE